MQSFHGSWANNTLLFSENPGLTLHLWGYIKLNEHSFTSLDVPPQWCSLQHLRRQESDFFFSTIMCSWWIKHFTRTVKDPSSCSQKSLAVAFLCELLHVAALPPVFQDVVVLVPLARPWQETNSKRLGKTTITKKGFPFPGWCKLNCWMMLNIPMFSQPQRRSKILKPSAISTRKGGDTVVGADSMVWFNVYQFYFFWD